MATAEQVRVYQLTRSLCQQFGITQSTLKHKGLQGSLSAASPQGNRVYEPPGPGDPTYATETAVWFASEPIDAMRGFRPGDDTPIGRQGIPYLRGQIPAIDDNGNAVVISQDDNLVDMSGIIWRIVDPAPTPELGVWTFGLIQQR